MAEVRAETESVVWLDWVGWDEHWTRRVGAILGRVSEACGVCRVLAILSSRAGRVEDGGEGCPFGGGRICALELI